MSKPHYEKLSRWCFRLLVVWAGITVSKVQAADIALVGVFPNKAVLVVDGASPKTYAIGDRIGEAKLVAVAEDSAVIENGNKRFTLLVGSAAIKTLNYAVSQESIEESNANGRQSITLRAGSGGHFVTQGQINGGAVTFLVDTGASSIYMGASDARRLRIDYSKGSPGFSSTANGVIRVYRVMLDRVRLGNITLYQVEAAVAEVDQPIILLGMSFLNRMDMQRNGDTMTLTKRF